MQDFKPDDLGEVKRPKRTRFCPRCQAETPSDNPACSGCGIVFDRIKSEVTGVLRPAAPQIQPLKTSGGGFFSTLAVLLAMGALGVVGWWWMNRAPDVADPSRTMIDPNAVRPRDAEPPPIAAPATPDYDPRGIGFRHPDASGASRAEPTPPPSATEAEERAWRARADRARADVAAAEAELARVEASMDVAPNMGVNAMDQQAEQIRRNRTSTARNQVESARARLDRLADECRRSAGCAPGWVR